MEELKDRLISSRKTAGYTQSEMRIELGFSENAIIKWEKGRVEPKFSLLSKWAKITKCDPKWLMTGETVGIIDSSVEEWKESFPMEWTQQNIITPAITGWAPTGNPEDAPEKIKGRKNWKIYSAIWEMAVHTNGFRKENIILRELLAKETLAKETLAKERDENKAKRLK